MKLFDTTMARLEAALDLRLENQNVLSGNLANLDTPGYKPRELDFGKAMAAAEAAATTPGGQAPTSAAPVEGHLSLEAAGPLASADAGRFVSVAKGQADGLDGNGVDLDKTMVELSRNALLYGASAKAASKKLAILKYVASDGVG